LFKAKAYEHLIAARANFEVERAEKEMDRRFYWSCFPPLHFLHGGYLYTSVGFCGTKMPLHLLHIRRIFLDARGLFAIRSHCRSQVPLALLKPTSPASCRLSTDWVVPAKQRLSARWGRRTPSKAKPAKQIRWIVSNYSPRRIAQIIWMTNRARLGQDAPSSGRIARPISTTGYVHPDRTSPFVKANRLCPAWRRLHLVHLNEIAGSAVDHGRHCDKA
jgi:hypothetical protein